MTMQRDTICMWTKENRDEVVDLYNSSANNIECIDLINSDEKSEDEKEENFSINSDELDDDIMFKQLYNGLNKPLGRRNKGYQLLTKIGYKEGDLLGINGKGLKDPIDISHLLNVFTRRKNLKKLKKRKNIEEVNQRFTEEKSLVEDISDKISIYNAYKAKIIFISDSILLRLDRNKAAYYIQHLRNQYKIFKLKEVIKNLDDINTNLESISILSANNNVNVELLMCRISYILRVYMISEKEVREASKSYNKIKKIEISIEKINKMLKVTYEELIRIFPTKC